ncbi:MAG: hypothetical protein IK080_09675 [Clostridia bacterium]|nr:hypothetical protein [Clostridia bacterium]
MAKIEGSWSGMRKYLEQEMLADSLRGRVRWQCVSFRDMDGLCMFSLCVDGVTVKQFSWETVNSYFIAQGMKSEAAAHPRGRREYWMEFQELRIRIPPQERTEYTDGEFCDALAAYRNQPIGESLCSADPLVRMFALLDRRVGKRRLAALEAQSAAWPAWLQALFHLRCAAECMAPAGDTP